MFWEIVGLAAAACVCTSFMPQIIKGLRTKSLDDLSLLFPVITATGIFLWLLYGIHLGDVIIIGANAVAFAQASTLVVLKMRYSGNSR